MIIQMEPTTHIVMVDGVECRLWNAITERGSQCFVFVHSVALPQNGEAHADDQREFEEMFEERKPRVIKAQT